jgi:hypothetical protein
MDALSAFKVGINYWQNIYIQENFIKLLKLAINYSSTLNIKGLKGPTHNMIMFK